MRKKLWIGAVGIALCLAALLFYKTHLIEREIETLEETVAQLSGEIEALDAEQLALKAATESVQHTRDTLAMSHELRGPLDWQCRQFLEAIQKETLDLRNHHTTARITLIDDGVYIGGEPFAVPTPFTIQQRAYSLYDDGTTYHAIYNVRRPDVTDRIESLNAYFIYQDGQWLLDDLDFDE